MTSSINKSLPIFKNIQPKLINENDYQSMNSKMAFSKYAVGNSSKKINFFIY